eukprot:4726294-Amphidinium_carterae.1
MRTFHVPSTFTHVVGAVAIKPAPEWGAPRSSQALQTVESSSAVGGQTFFRMNFPKTYESAKKFVK